MMFHRARRDQSVGASPQPIPVGIGKVRDAPDGPFQRGPSSADWGDPMPAARCVGALDHMPSYGLRAPSCVRRDLGS